MVCRRKQWLRCTKLRICALLSVVLIFTVVFKVHSLIKKTLCRNDEMHENFKQLCQMYKESQIDGIFCNHLCITHDVLPQHCLGTRHGKQIALAKWHNDNIILKSKKRFFHEFDMIAYVDNSSHTFVLPSDEEFFTTLQNSVGSNIGRAVLETGSELLPRMWPDNYKQFLNHKNSATQYRASAMNSVCSLTQQTEYVLLQYFNKRNKHLPRVLGTCGHFYAVEYAPPGLDLDPALVGVTTSTAWRKRAQLALGILDVLLSFETDFLEPLYMCDIKGSNFGVAQDGTVKVIDVDTVFFRSDLETIFDQPCYEHKDCDFFDCQAWCEPTTHRCWKKIFNNNLQVVCAKIFSGSQDNMFRGLLSHAPYQWSVQLQKLLDHCANPEDDLTDRRGVASTATFHKLKRLLKVTMV